MRVRWLLLPVVSTALAVSLVLLAGCDFSTEWDEPGPRSAPREEAEVAPEPEPEPPPRPSWRTVDRNALAASLGWGEVTSGNKAGVKIALTFDAGSGGEPVPAILDALKAAGIHSTFFLTGQFADTYPDIVKRIAGEGHELGNHSYTHPRFTTITPEEARSQVERTEARVLELTGLSTKPYFRFPYGSSNTALVKQLNDMGYLSVFWTLDTLDWEPGITPEQIIARVSRAGPGTIVLLHCGSAQEAQALPVVIGNLRAAGYEPVTLTEALSP